MPQNKEAVIRYNIIDKCLTNRYNPFPSMDDLIEACEEELGTDFSVSTIQKDIKAMKEDKGLGYMAPIRFSKAENGYYYSDPVYTIRSIGLNDKEIEAIEFATGLLKNFQGIKVNDAYNTAVDKIFTSIKAKTSDKDKTLVHAIQLEETTHLRGIEDLDKYIYCIKEKIPISFVHYSFSKKTYKANIIHPYLLKESNKRWYLVGYSEEHKELRNFGIDRIYEPVMLDLKFIDHSGGDLRELYKNKIGLSPLESGKPETITLWVSDVFSKYILSMPLHESQTVTEHIEDGSIRITMNLVPTYELISKVLSYGEHMEVESPKWLIKEITTALNKTAKRYEAKKRK